jgi:hypothetical protein
VGRVSAAAAITPSWPRTSRWRGAKRRPGFDVGACGHRLAEAAAVRAIANGSQHSTMSAISHRIARSLSVSAPMSSATYLIGALSVSICRPASVDAVALAHG